MLGNILSLVGLVIALFGGLWLLVEAFKESILWGLGYLFFPIVGLIFIVVHWKKAQRPFGYLLLGWVLILVGQVLSPGRRRLGSDLPGRRPAEVRVA